MNQREDVQDQLDILATNLEIVNQKLATTNLKKGGGGLAVADSSQTIEELKKIQNWIKSLIDHMIKLESNSEEQIKNYHSLDSKVTLLSPLPKYAKEAYSQLKILTPIQDNVSSISSKMNLLTEIHQKIEPISLLTSMNSTVNDIKSQSSTLSSLSTQVQSVLDSLENQRKIVVENQSRILYLEKLNKHTYEKLHQEIQQLPYRPVDEETKAKMLKFPEDEHMSTLHSISEEMKLSRKQFPALFAFVIVIITIFGLGLLGLIIFLITRTN